MKILLASAVLLLACHVAFAASPTQSGIRSKLIVTGPQTVTGPGVIGGPAKNTGVIKGQPIMRRHYPS
jgi:hypothetical protein